MCVCKRKDECVESQTILIFPPYFKMSDSKLCVEQPLNIYYHLNNGCIKREHWPHQKTCREQICLRWGKFLDGGYH